MRPTLHKKRILASHFPDCVGNTLVLRKSRFDDVIVVRRRLRGKGCGSMFHIPHMMIKRIIIFVNSNSCAYQSAEDSAPPSVNSHHDNYASTNNI